MKHLLFCRYDEDKPVSFLAPLSDTTLQVSEGVDGHDIPCLKVVRPDATWFFSMSSVEAAQDVVEAIAHALSRPDCGPVIEICLDYYEEQNE